MKRIDLVGQTFGRLIVVSFSHVGGSGNVFWNCKCVCGQERVVRAPTLKNGHTKSCGCLPKHDQSGEKNKCWKGGRTISSGGYALVRIGNEYVLEHRRVMESFLGRSLEVHETVHHKNGHKDDNRIENLELWSSRHPRGQKISDLVAWAKETLVKYEPETFYSPFIL